MPPKLEEENVIDLQERKGKRKEDIRRIAEFTKKSVNEAGQQLELAGKIGEILKKGDFDEYIKRIK